MVKRIVCLMAVVFVLLPSYLLAQVTTSTLSGTITSGTEPLAGATVTATHQPTGTVYRSSSLKQGVFNLVNLIPGGPYTVEVSFVGFQTYTQPNVTLALGENTRIDIALTAGTTTLESVVVTGT